MPIFSYRPAKEGGRGGGGNYRLAFPWWSMPVLQLCMCNRCGVLSAIINRPDSTLSNASKHPFTGTQTYNNTGPSSLHIYQASPSCFWCLGSGNLISFTFEWKRGQVRLTRGKVFCMGGSKSADQPMDTPVLEPQPSQKNASEGKPWVKLFYPEHSFPWPAWPNSVVCARDC